MPYEFAEFPEMGYFAEPEPVEGYGEYAEDPYGYSEPPEYAGWGEPEVYGYGEYEPVGYYAEEPYYGEADPYGYYAEPPEYAGWGEPEMYGYGEYEPVGYYAEEPYYGEADPYGYYAEPPEYGEYEPVGYAEMPEMVGYGEYEPLAEDYPGMASCGEPYYAGYERDVPSPFNAGCPLPTNVAGFGEAPLEGYVRPVDVSPTCERFTPQPGPTPLVPETFRPLW